MHAIGMPEGALALAQVAIHLASSPKSNSIDTAYKAAVDEIQASGNLVVPLHLRNAPTRLMEEEEGYGDGYVYAHDLAEGVAAMACLPDEISDRQFYVPGERGDEVEIAERMRAAAKANRPPGAADILDDVG